MSRIEENTTEPKQSMKRKEISEDFKPEESLLNLLNNISTPIKKPRHEMQKKTLKERNSGVLLHSKKPTVETIPNWVFSPPYHPYSRKKEEQAETDCVRKLMNMYALELHSLRKKVGERCPQHRRQHQACTSSCPAKKRILSYIKIIQGIQSDTESKPTVEKKDDEIEHLRETFRKFGRVNDLEHKSMTSSS